MTADDILAEAGWTLLPGWAGFTKGTLVGGVQPDGLAAHIKDWDKVHPGEPLYSADTPDTAEEAAAWLVARFAPAPTPEPVEQDEQYAEVPLDADFEAVDDYGDGEDPLLTYTEGDEADEPIDEPEPQFIFGDNLATDRLVRIGQIAEHARTLIAETRAAVGWDGDEFAALQGYVVSHLNESGAFVGSDAAAFERFMRLSDAQRRERAIEIVRDDKQDHIRAAGHEAVAMFDVSADWP